MYALYKYQEDAITEMTNSVISNISLPGTRYIVLKSPTGSGKTIMIAETIRRIRRNQELGLIQNKCAFIWISPRKLHDQSKSAVEQNYFNTDDIKCSFPSDLIDRKIHANEILFVNWESINKADNIFFRENEQDFYLNKVIERTKEDGVEIILIIDESHHTATSDKSRDLILEINPKIVLSVSATPFGNDGAYPVTVLLEDVINEGVIKKLVKVNCEFDNNKVNIDNDREQEFVIKESVKKRKALCDMYLSENPKNPVNPLMLIQIPDNTKGIEDISSQIITTLSECGISEKKGNLAIWLSEKHTPNLEFIEINENPVEVLIFKQAIALGWNCPRASILVTFRNIGEKTNGIFTSQTIGRIMRMPELKHYDEYNHDALNYAYVYTNIRRVELKIEKGFDNYICPRESIARSDFVTDNINKIDSYNFQITYHKELLDNLPKEDLITVSNVCNGLFESITKIPICGLTLKSIHIERDRNKDRLRGSDFKNIFFECAKDIVNKLNTNPKRTSHILISDAEIKDIDREQTLEPDKNGIGAMKIYLSDADIQEQFNLTIREWVKPFAAWDSSETLKKCIYDFFEKCFNGYEEEDIHIQLIVLDEVNKKLFNEVIERAKSLYRKRYVTEQQRITTSRWEIPKSIICSNIYEEIPSKKSVLYPLYMRDISKPEMNFIDFLENSDDVKWFFRNGSGESKYFAIPYKDEQNRVHAFYPDFIVGILDGRIGIFDTKSGITASSNDAKLKAEALVKYIQTENVEGKNLIGGIVISKNSSLFVNISSVYKYRDDDLDEWVGLNQLFKGINNSR